MSSIELAYFNGVADAGASRAITATSLAPADLILSNRPELYFPTVFAGDIDSKSLMVTNIGGIAATLGTLSASGLGLASPFGFDGGTCQTGGAVAANGGTCTLAITFAPTDAGVMNDSVDLSYSNGLYVDTVSRKVRGASIWPGILSISDGPTYPYGAISPRWIYGRVVPSVPPNK